MLRKEDEEWLERAHPRLVPDATGITGILTFRATYNPGISRFLLLADGVPDTVGGVTLCGEFTIRITQRRDASGSALPALHVDGVDAIADRHFGQGIACLCSPFEEGEFLQPEFSLRKYIEELVVPFLYAQVFYSDNKCWPWPEYSHGAVGLLESYAKRPEEIDAGECLRWLRAQGVWQRVRAALAQKSNIGGHTPCFCPKKEPMRRCHPEALRGAQLLREEIRASKIEIP